MSLVRLDLNNITFFYKSDSDSTWSSGNYFKFKGDNKLYRTYNEIYLTDAPSKAIDGYMISANWLDIPSPSKRDFNSFL